jgi:hypothetical protein
MERAGADVTSWTADLRTDVDELVRYMLMADEAPILEPIAGVSSFAATFAARGPRDAKGRSLRALDLRSRLFTHPLSYTIYSAMFDALPAAVRERVYRGLYDVLASAETPPGLPRLSRGERQAVIDIVAATKAGAPEYWMRAKSED